MPNGFKLQQDSPDHWSVVVKDKMTTEDYDRKVRELIQSWKVMGMYVRYE